MIQPFVVEVRPTRRRRCLATLILNTLRGTIRTCAVKSLGFGEQHKALLEDIAVLTATQVVDTEAGLALDKLPLLNSGVPAALKLTATVRPSSTVPAFATSLELVSRRSGSKFKTRPNHSNADGSRSALPGLSAASR